MTSAWNGEGAKNAPILQTNIINFEDKEGGNKIFKKSCGRHIWKPPKLKQENMRVDRIA